MLYPVIGPQTAAALIVASPSVLPRLAPKAFTSPWHYWAAGLPVPNGELNLLPSETKPAVLIAASQTKRGKAQRATRQHARKANLELRAQATTAPANVFSTKKVA